MVNPYEGHAEHLVARAMPRHDLDSSAREPKVPRHETTYRRVRPVVDRYSRRAYHQAARPHLTHGVTPRSGNHANLDELHVAIDGHQATLFRRLRPGIGTTTQACADVISDLIYRPAVLKGLVVLALSVMAACSSSSQTDPRSEVYAACREAVFHNEQGLEAAGRDSVIWPKLRSPSLNFHTKGKRYSLRVRHVTVDAGGQNSNAVVDCEATQDDNGHWNATASVDS